jgi:hypothetical protein
MAEKCDILPRSALNIIISNVPAEKLLCKEIRRDFGHGIGYGKSAATKAPHRQALPPLSSACCVTGIADDRLVSEQFFQPLALGWLREIPPLRICH